jgi:SPP1 gp7 family putative phage head morphogenesis protein
MADAAELTGVFHEKPQNVIDYFKKKQVKGVNPKKAKVTGGASHWDWSDTLRSAHDRVFVVSKATSMALVADIKKELSKAIENGQSYQDFANKIIPALKEKGWWGDGEKVNEETGESARVNVDHRRLRNIYQTNVTTAYAAGQYERMMDNTDIAPYWRYVAKPSGPTRRKEHQALNNLVFRYDDPFWKTNYPPNGWGCQCRVEALSPREVRRKYGKPADDVVTETKPEDFTTQTVEVQGKTIAVTGYKAGGTVVYPSPGWDYAPGSYAYRYQKMLEEKIYDLPDAEARQKMMRQLDSSIKDSFREMVRVDGPADRTDKKGEAYTSIGIMPDNIRDFFDGGKKGGSAPVRSSILTFDQRRIHHTLRETHNGIPMETLGEVPSLIERYTPTYRTDSPMKSGLIFFSEPFDFYDAALKKTVKKRNKIVFNFDKENPGTMTYDTGEIVDSDDFNRHTPIKK